jgi:hypothetical protein
MDKYDFWGLEQQQQYQDDLDTLYSFSIKEGYDCSFSEHFENSLGLYGETSRTATEHCMEQFREYFNDPEGVFYDLGSGLGKMACHISLGSKLSKVCGIELDRIRHRKAIKLANSLSFPLVAPQLINDDIFNCDFSDATIMFFDNTMWNSQLEKKKELVEKLFETIRPGVLIISKLMIPHIACHRKYVRLESSYTDDNGFASIFLSFKT